jgi:hypothetical protein
VLVHCPCVQLRRCMTGFGRPAETLSIVWYVLYSTYITYLPGLSHAYTTQNIIIFYGTERAVSFWTR